MRSCWQIRQELSEKNGKSLTSAERDGHRSNGWLVACTECTVYISDQSCWERCSGSPCCCAPIHVTCDFCALYIEHRREIAGLLQASEATTPLPLMPEPARPLRHTLHGKGEITGKMEKLQLNVPDMWADHHVLKVRAILTAMPGVQDVIASSAFRIVVVNYEPAFTNPGAIMGELDDAGYSVATDGTGVIAESVPVADGRRDPAWTRLGMRQMKTDERDLKTKR